MLFCASESTAAKTNDTSKTKLVKGNTYLQEDQQQNTVKTFASRWSFYSVQACLKCSPLTQGGGVNHVGTDKGQIRCSTIGLRNES